MFTPYDWQEAMGHRAQFVESKLALGTPVVALSIKPGILLFTFRRQARKLFEIYDRLALGAIGLQSDVEAIRLAAVDFAHQVGYAHSEEDVTLHRVMAAISVPVKQAFANFTSAPFVAQSLFAEVCENPESDCFAVLEYDGDFRTCDRLSVAAADNEVKRNLQKKIGGLKSFDMDVKEATKALEEIWKEVIPATIGDTDGVGEPSLEIALMERKPKGESRFKFVTNE